MELIIKLYKDKTSRLGIKYAQEYQAVKVYEELINTYGQAAFKLRIELHHHKADLTLLPQQGGKSFSYKAVDYNVSQLQKLQTYITQGTPLEFLHVFSKSNVLVVAKPFRSQRFVTVSEIEFLGAQVYNGAG